MCLSTMDRAIFVLLLCLDFHLSRGQDKADASGTILLRLPFDPYYNYYEKCCCKFYQGVCVPFVDNRNYAANLYKGRLSIEEYNGLMVVKIWNLQKSDAGVYRCAVMESPYQIYTDITVKISDSANRQSPPLPSLRSTTSPTTVTTSITPVESESLNESQTNESPRFKADTWIILAAALGMLMLLILIISVTAVVVHRRKKDQKKSGTAPCDRTSSFPSGSSSQDVNGIVYTTVNFNTREEPAGVYANLTDHKSPAARKPQTYGRQNSSESVEYSTLAVRQ